MNKITTKNKTIFERGSIKIEIKSGADHQMLDHFKETVLGTPGGLQYKHTQIKSKLEKLGKVFFMLLKRKDKILGSIGLAYRQTFSNKESYASWYIRYFAIRAPLRAKKYKKNPEKNPSDGSSLFLKLGEKYFNNPNLFENEESKSPSKSIIYGYTEKENHRSIAFTEKLGFVPVRIFYTLLFSRLQPKTHSNVRALKTNEKEDVRNMIRSFYADYSLLSFQSIYFDQRYLVYIEDNKIVAGLQANPDRWEIHALGGRAGKILLKLLPLIPGIKKIFKPGALNFLGIEGVFYLPGYEKCIEALLESACHKFNTGLAMIWVDANSGLLNKLDHNIHYGVLNNLMKRFEAEVRIKFNGFSEKEIATFYSKPAYISAIDMT